MSRRNRAPLRRQMIDRRGHGCRVCGEHEIQMAHIWPTGQGGPDVIENVTPLCLEHHTAYDQYRLKLQPEWLGFDQLEWLAAVGYVRWGLDGTPTGKGLRRFADRAAA